MSKPDRSFNTEISYYVEDFTGKTAPREIKVDLTKLPDDELIDMVSHVPEATSEIVYRELYGQ